MRTVLHVGMDTGHVAFRAGTASDFSVSVHYVRLSTVMILNKGQLNAATGYGQMSQGFPQGCMPKEGRSSPCNQGPTVG